uniref:Uncharacterized protein n=1 Tax=Arundo donax TaxID=35708 RepID=A0A0A8Z4K4_ARUDO
MNGVCVTKYPTSTMNPSDTRVKKPLTEPLSYEDN